MSPSPTDHVSALPAPFAASPVSMEVPSFVDVGSTLTDVAADGVSAPSEDVSGLETVVARAQDLNIDLSIVVLSSPAQTNSQLRDLATTVGSSDGGTVLVLGPGQVGTFSDSIDRVTLEAGQDRAYTGDVVLSANNFLDVVTEPGPPWTAITIALVVLVAVVLGGTWWANVRRHGESARGATSSPDVSTRTADHDTGEHDGRARGHVTGKDGSHATD
ncbi:MAG: DUF6676 family protein [Rhodococcus sp. (in: high G+C Gram-positive bacteria)]